MSARMRDPARLVCAPESIPWRLKAPARVPMRWGDGAREALGVSIGLVFGAVVAVGTWQLANGSALELLAAALPVGVSALLVARWNLARRQTTWPR